MKEEPAARPTVSILICLLLLCTFSQSVQAGMAQLASEARGRLFTVHGSNTIGASMMKNFLLDFLTGKGVRDIQVIAGPLDNEYRVQGYLADERVYVDVAAHGSSTGFRGLASGDADIAMSSRRIKPEELASLRHLGDLQNFRNEHVIAIDGLALIVHPENPVQSLSLSQIAQVFSGRLNNWSGLGGSDEAIALYARDENSGTWDTFNSLVLGDGNDLSPRARRFESNDQLSDLVANDPRGIGFVGLASVRSAKAVAVSANGARALQPEVLVVATEDYALSRRLYLYTADDAGPWIRDFVSFVHSDRGQQQVERTGFVSQNLVSVAGQLQGDAPAAYVQLAAHAERLSANLRFDEGSAELDNKAQRDIERILQYMQRPENAGKEIVLVGFGDQKQRESRALVLSKLRATAVKSQLFRRGVLSAPVVGLGAHRPVASNQGAERTKNQRVEVWVRDSQVAAPAL